ncbi:hypothetical protein GCM10010452_57190 [Crossiella cryophila]
MAEADGDSLLVYALGADCYGEAASPENLVTVRESPLKFVLRVSGCDLLENASVRAVPGLHVHAEPSLNTVPAVIRGGGRDEDAPGDRSQRRLLVRRGVSVDGLSGWDTSQACTWRF